MVSGVEVREVPLADGIVIRCHLSGGPGSPAMVLLHALGEQAASWNEVATRFATRFRVVALDLRGHGASTWLGVYSFTIRGGRMRCRMVKDGWG
jgi:pimeloyl-ACP methyl ester carboxylesterase